MTDLIERQSVIDIAMCYCPDDDGSCSKADMDIRELLDDIENLTAINRWIPCSERFPSDLNYVLCSGRDGIGVLRYIGSKWIDENAISYSTNEITHWMPLPEPPESEVQDDDER